jgi:hypothetical protein
MAGPTGNAANPAATPSAAPSDTGSDRDPSSATPPHPDRDSSDSEPSDAEKAPAAAAKSPATAAPKATKPTPTKPAAAKPSPRVLPKPVVKTDVVVEAQKFIYGRGVAQDCDRGLRILKPAAEQSNPKAMIEMGALYSAGLCTPHDLPTAYRWFALALRRDPESQEAQADLKKLWSEMTQPERQLAIKLTQ